MRHLILLTRLILFSKGLRTRYFTAVKFLSARAPCGDTITSDTKDMALSAGCGRDTLDKKSQFDNPSPCR